MGPYDEWLGLGLGLRRAAGERGKNEEGLGREDGARAPSLPLSHLESLDFSLVTVFVRFH